MSRPAANSHPLGFLLATDGVGTLAPGDELADVAKKLVRALYVNCVPGSGNHRECGIRDSDAHLPGNADKLAIETAGDQQDWYGDFAESVPIRRLGALSHAAETVGQA